MKKIALLFLFGEKLNHENIWKKFIKNNKNKYNIYGHAKNNNNKDPFMKQFIIPQFFYTSWGDISLVRVMIALLEEAIKNKDNYKFIFLSESCIPLKSFDYIYDYLTKNNKSYINYYKGHLERANNIIDKQRHPKFKTPELNTIKNNYLKSPQWIILNREHTQIIINTKNYTRLFEKTSCPDEHYFATILNF